MVDFRILNGSPKCTLIERFDGGALILSGGKRMEFPNIEECKKYIAKNGLEINISHIFGSSIKREIQKGEQQ